MIMLYLFVIFVLSFLDFIYFFKNNFNFETQGDNTILFDSWKLHYLNIIGQKYPKTIDKKLIQTVF